MLDITSLPLQTLKQNQELRLRLNKIHSDSNVSDMPQPPSPTGTLPSDMDMVRMQVVCNTSKVTCTRQSQCIQYHFDCCESSRIPGLPPRHAKIQQNPKAQVLPCWEARWHTGRALDPGFDTRLSHHFEFSTGLKGSSERCY
jgi:hypothetical protein